MKAASFSGLIAVVGGLLTAAMPGCGPTPQAKDGAAGRAVEAPAVEVVQSVEGSLPLSERVSGLVRARNQVSVRAEISAPVAEVLVGTGDKVKKGQLLVRLRDDVPRQQLRQAEADVRLAEAEVQASAARVAETRARLVRQRALAAEHLVSDVELETAEAQVQVDEAGLAQDQAQLEQARAHVAERTSARAKTEVRAPIAGHVGKRNAEVGMLVDAGTVLFEVGDLDRLLVEIPLGESLVSQISPGQPVDISLGTSADAPFRAAISRVSPFLSSRSFSTTAEIDLPQPPSGLRPGMFAAVDVLYGQSEQATLVPVSALWEDPRTARRGVYVVELSPDAKPSDTLVAPSAETHAARFQPAEIVAQGASTAAIRGVEPGQWVVSVGHQMLQSDGVNQVHVRPTTWDRVAALQRSQVEDVVGQFMAKQRRLAASMGPVPPPADNVHGTRDDGASSADRGAAGT